MENPRTDSARTHDDHAMIDAAQEAPDKVGREGGNLARDIGTQDELARVDDPETSTRVTKQDDIDNGVARPSDRARGA
ncbi:hypothetical protein ACBY01_00270 [Sphingomonas sp. ac-8]|uniref:hypothetical protein n=1 Tax=Sphingomonas sp. ac-8 TaxID=3242977 RepID=UPI003A7F72E1